MNDYISKQEILEYMKKTKLYDDIKDKYELQSESTYKNTNLYDFIKDLPSKKVIFDK